MIHKSQRWSGLSRTLHISCWESGGLAGLRGDNCHRERRGCALLTWARGREEQTPRPELELTGKKKIISPKKDNFTSLGQSPIYSSLSLCLIWHHPSFQGMSPCRNVWHLWGNWTPISPPVPAPGWQFSFENLVLYEDLFINHQRKKRKQEIRRKKPNLSWFIWSVGVEHDSCFISSNTCTQFCQGTKNCTQWIALADLRHWETSFTPSPLQ